MIVQAHQDNAVFLNAIFFAFSGACGTPPSGRQTVLSLFPENASENELKNIDFVLLYLDISSQTLQNRKRAVCTALSKFFK